MFLPRPYPDELVGSLLHRAERQLGIGRERLLLRLTGHKLSSHSFLITQYAGIAEAYGFSMEEFLHKHTVLQYMTAFMRTEERQRAFSQFVDERRNRSSTASLVRRAVMGEQWLRLCPNCVENELRQYGESYWHRVHQFSGVEMCVQHSVDLRMAMFRICRASGIPPPHEVASVPNTLAPDIPRALKLAIAAASAKALWTVANQDFLVQTYQVRVREFGYVYIGGKLHGALLAHDLGTFFGQPFLSRYDSAIGTSRKGRWPAKLLHASSHHATTFKHILLNVFLDSSPTPSVSRVDFEVRRRPKHRDWRKIEHEAIAALTAEVARHEAAGTRANLEDLYGLARIRSVVKGHKHQIPRLMSWIEQFKKSPQSARIPGRRPRQ